MIKNTKKSFEVSGADGTLFRGVGGGKMQKLSRSNLPKNEQLVAELAIWSLPRLIVRNMDHYPIPFFRLSVFTPKLNLFAMQRYYYY